ncbi:MAG: hypothetical protein BMS9Abin26_0719 [Gammaproteobacteria bacterium]|nr:MAG: hypothetical protein BMS9Abin26_0719 [Gammaproteobacteria bacterium]
MEAVTEDRDLFTQGYEQAVKLLNACCTEDGFLASPTANDNYRRIWARDGVIIGLAGLLSNYHDLANGLKLTLETLARHQGIHGEIPSNVDPISGRVSYGGTTGRVDADLWFIIGCGEYWQATRDDDFLERVLPAIEKVRFLLGAWEFNGRGLLYVPQAGDWADEYLHTGYVLYDQLLYLQAQQTISYLHAQVHGSSDHVLIERLSRLRHLIRANYWFEKDQCEIGDRYHEVLYAKGCEAAKSRMENFNYWLPSFSPTGYSYRFDAFANILASLFNIADDDQRHCVDEYIEAHVRPELPVLPAFQPVIKPLDQDWQELQMTFSYTFKNKPHEFHNGGLWPMLSGFYVADLASRDQQDRARYYLEAIHRANQLEMNEQPWSFPEYVHGKLLTAGGTFRQGWSAAAAIIGHHALQGDKVFHVEA